MNPLRHANDPVKLVSILWPEVTLYRKEREILYSVWDNDETVVPAAHMVGKDFTAAICCLAFFLTRNPCRVLTTSVDGYQLETVLWGEIKRFIQTSRYPLEYEKGGPLVVNHLHIRKVVRGQVCGLSYMMGRVAEKGEGLSGHHIAQTGDGIPRTLFVGDEASGLDEVVFEKASEWANRQLIIGNPYDCRNYFYYAVEGNPKILDDRGGDIVRDNGRGYRRKIIEITAEDSPNVQFARAQLAAGQEPTGEIVIPGVLPWDVFLDRRKRWDVEKQTVGLDAKFYKGKRVLLYPEEWLVLAQELADAQAGKRRQARAIGIDPGEGSADTSWAAVDEFGLLELVSYPTPNTSQVPRDTIDFGRKWGVDPEDWVFDRGGGGKQHADRLREMGYDVRTVAFGEGVMLQPRDGMILTDERVATREERYAYTNRRAQMYGELSLLLDPGEGSGWAIPRRYSELLRQMRLVPKMRDREGRLEMLPKNRKDPKDKRPTLTDLLGRSPDDLDAVVLAVHGMLHREVVYTAGAE